MNTNFSLTRRRFLADSTKAASVFAVAPALISRADAPGDRRVEVLRHASQQSRTFKPST